MQTNDRPGVHREAFLKPAMTAWLRWHGQMYHLVDQNPVVTQLSGGRPSAHRDVQGRWIGRERLPARDPTRSTYVDGQEKLFYGKLAEIGPYAVNGLRYPGAHRLVPDLR